MTRVRSFRPYCRVGRFGQSSIGGCWLASWYRQNFNRQTSTDTNSYIFSVSNRWARIISVCDDPSFNQHFKACKLILTFTFTDTYLQLILCNNLFFIVTIHIHIPWSGFVKCHNMSNIDTCIDLFVVWNFSLGAEALAFQGLMLSDLPNAGEVTHTDSQLYDMAGNAFLGFGLIRSDSSILVTLTATVPYPLFTWCFSPGKILLSS